MFNRPQDAVNRRKADDLSESQATMCDLDRRQTAIEEEALGHREFVPTRLFESA